MSETKYLISKNELLKAKDFFSNSEIDLLTDISIRINSEQPNFSAAVLAFELNGIDRVKTEDILESIFTIYYIHIVLKKVMINTISSGQIKKNIKWFGDFLIYYNKENEYGTVNILEMKFLRDDIVLNYALDTLLLIFGALENIPKEVVFAYFAILKGIEIGAEKGN